MHGDYVSSSSHSTEYSYDENGNLIEKKDKESSGNVEIYKYAYDENGDIINEEKTNSNGTYSYDYRYVYDENGNLIEKALIYLGKEKVNTYTYDKFNQLVREEVLYSDGKKDTDTYVYDENQRLIKHVQLDYKGETDTYTYSYDENGNLIQEEIKYGSGSVYTWSFGEYQIYFRPGKNNDQRTYINEWLKKYN